MAMVMSSQKTALGFTAALMGSLHLMLASLSTPITGLLLPISLTYWFIFLLIAGVVSLGLTIWSGRLSAETFRAEPESLQPEPGLEILKPQSES